jgi:methionyl-tRNA formyltransferase
MASKTPDVVFLGINDIGEDIYQWLCDRDDCRILALLTTKEQLNTVKELSPDLIISAGYRHIIPSDILDVPGLGCVNLHKSFLPKNRGANPNVWSIVESAPAGVSIHYMTEDIDEGPIINRRRVPIYPDDSGKTLYNRLESAQFDQFQKSWPEIRDGSVNTKLQVDLKETPTHHRKQEFVNLWRLDLDTTKKVGCILDKLRALTFPPYKNAYFEKDGKKYFIEIDITPEEKVNKLSPDNQSYDLKE